MADLINKASESMRSLILEALGTLVAEGDIPAEPIPAFGIEIPADKSHGDFASNVAMVCAKPFRMPPRKSLSAESFTLKARCSSARKLQARDLSISSSEEAGSRTW